MPYCTSITCMLIIACRPLVLEFAHWTAKKNAHENTRARITTTYLPPGWKKTARATGTIRVLTYAVLCCSRHCRVLMTLSYFAVGCYFCQRLYRQSRHVQVLVVQQNTSSSSIYATYCDTLHASILSAT